jgi:Circadian oscillating protein COP23
MYATVKVDSDYAESSVMKWKRFCSLHLLVFLLPTLGLLSPTLDAQAEGLGRRSPPVPNVRPQVDPTSTTFVCQEIDNTPTTVAQSVDGDIPVIQWKNKKYPDSNETSLERCSRVSIVIQDHIQQGTIHHIKIGKMDDKEVVCSANSKSAACDFLIFNLEKDENPQETLEVFLYLINNPLVLPSKRQRIQMSSPSIPPTRLSGRLNQGISSWRNSLKRPTSRRMGGAR